MKTEISTLLNLKLGAEGHVKITLCDNPSNPYHAKAGQEAFIYQFKSGSIRKNVWITPYGVYGLV